MADAPIVLDFDLQVSVRGTDTVRCFSGELTINEHDHWRCNVSHGRRTILDLEGWRDATVGEIVDAIRAALAA